MRPRVALLRAVNVTGNNPLPMARLRAVLEGLGLSEVRTLLQSGNAVFRGGPAGPALERAVEAALEKRLGLRVDCLVREAAEWEAIVERNPFPRQAKADPGHLLVMALKRAPAAAAVKALRAAIRGRERIRAAGRELYIVYPDGVGRSTLTTALIEKTLGTRGTGRNWNTTLKLLALVKP